MRLLPLSAASAVTPAPPCAAARTHSYENAGKILSRPDLVTNASSTVHCAQRRIASRLPPAARWLRLHRWRQHGLGTGQPLLSWAMVTCSSMDVEPCRLTVEPAGSVISGALIVSQTPDEPFKLRTAMYVKSETTHVILELDIRSARETKMSP